MTSILILTSILIKFLYQTLVLFLDTVLMYIIVLLLYGATEPC